MNVALIILWLCAAVAVAVFATMIICVIKSDSTLNEGVPKIVSSKMIETFWTLIPIAIVSATAILAVRRSVFVH